MQSTPSSHHNDVREQSKVVSDDFAAIRSDLSQLAESVRNLAADGLGTSVEGIQAKATEKISEAEKAIRRNPTQAALIAAGVGFLVGLIMIR